MTRQIQPGNIFFTARATRVENGFIVRPVARGHLKNEEIDAYYSFDMLCCLSQNFKYFLRFIGNSYLAAGGVASAMGFPLSLRETETEITLA